MEETVSCPVCNGTKLCRSQKYYSDVFDRSKYETCWFCKGTGLVAKAPTQRIQITKYWSVNGKELDKESD